ncbi:MAG: glycerol-3-phosphate dehydrogenase C-terminal domain-containing protein, partial [Myxococcota bacterium]
PKRSERRTARGSAWAGVRPLVADQDEATPSVDVSREHRIEEDRSGLYSMAGGKLTTHRVMAEELVDRLEVVLRRTDGKPLLPCSTDTRPLREDPFDAFELQTSLRRRYRLSPRTASRLVRSWGLDASTLLHDGGAVGLSKIGDSDYRLAELRWAAMHESPETLNDLLERRTRTAFFARASAFNDARRASHYVAPFMGWSIEEANNQARLYRETIKRRFTVS